MSRHLPGNRDHAHLFPAAGRHADLAASIARPVGHAARALGTGPQHVTVYETPEGRHVSRWYDPAEPRWHERDVAETPPHVAALVPETHRHLLPSGTK